MQADKATLIRLQASIMDLAGEYNLSKDRPDLPAEMQHSIKQLVEYVLVQADERYEELGSPAML